MGTKTALNIRVFFGFILIVLMNSTHLYAQEIEQKEINEKWGWYLNLNYSYIGRSTFDFFILTTTNEYQIETKTIFKPTFDLGLTYQLNNKFYALAGMGYNDNGHYSRRLEVVGFKESFHMYRANYLSPELGIGLKNKFFFDKLHYKIMHSWKYNIYLGENKYVPEFRMVDVLNWKNYLSTGLSTGVGYSVGNKTSINAGFNFDTNITQTTKKETNMDAVNMGYLRYNLQLGISRKF